MKNFALLSLSTAAVLLTPAIVSAYPERYENRDRVVIVENRDRDDRGRFYEHNRRRNEFARQRYYENQERRSYYNYYPQRSYNNSPTFGLNFRFGY